MRAPLLATTTKDLLDLFHNPIVLALILFEVLFSSLNNKNLYKREDTLCTIGLLSGNILMVFVLKGATLALHFYLFQFKLINLSEIIPIWTLWLITFVMIDLVFYIYHRISHRVNFLWAIHMQPSNASSPHNPPAKAKMIMCWHQIFSY